MAVPASESEASMRSRHNSPVKVILSYVLDWSVLLIVGIVSAILGNIEPRKRPLSLSDPNISLPFSESETVPLWLLGVLIGAFPLLTILIITFIFVPGTTVPRYTPRAMIWRRKLWEFHASSLGLFTAHIIAFFFSQGMKCLFGKPRPDFLDRCQPATTNLSDHVVGGFFGQSIESQLYGPSICQQKDLDILNDGFRSYPSGHSSAAAAGLVYLSLFIASRLGVTIPSIPPSAFFGEISHFAFPSRTSAPDPVQHRISTSSQPIHGRNVARPQSLRNQNASPPLYLLAVALVPFALSVYISASRWFDYRHHGFDILFGYFIGLLPAIFCFRYYHLPISSGAGWAWGPRSADRAFWAGVGRLGYRSQSAGESSVPTKVQRGHSNELGCAHTEVLRQPFTQQMTADTNSGQGPASQTRKLQSYASSVYSASVYTADGPLKPQDGGNLTDHFDIEMQRFGGR